MKTYLQYFRRCQGLSLIEITIAAGLGLLMVLMIFSLLQQQVATTQRLQKQRFSIKTKDLFFQRFLKSFNRASLSIETIGISIQGSGEDQRIVFDLLAGPNTYNCLGSLMPAHRLFSETYFFNNTSIYCTSRYQQSLASTALQKDTQPLLSHLEGWAVFPYLVQAQAENTTSQVQCLQGLDLQLVYETQVFHRRFIAPECIQWK